MVAAFARRSGDVVITGLSMSDVDATMIRVLLIFGVVTVIAVAAATTAGIVIIRRALAPLRRVAQTAGEVVDLPLDRGEVALPMRVLESDANPRTEVGQLGSALNRMLDHIAAALSTRQASETRVRQFVADASHELRTPLAAIRGYTELAQRVGDDTDAVAHAMSRVQSETERMTHLVEDLLLLARLDSGRPLGTRTGGPFAGGGRRGQRRARRRSGSSVGARPARRAGGCPGRCGPAASGADEPTGQRPCPYRSGHRGDDAIGVGRNACRTERVRQRARNSGALQSEVFERFARGDTSRSRKGGSTGLGLAIVSAVVKAHNGTITLDSAPGHTEFTVRLQLAES